jgi:uncharacterized phage infection (PIP) family protein YhgE
MASVLVLAASASSSLFADDDYEHFEAVESPDLETALENLAEYNEKLRAILDGGSLSGSDMGKVHELTYTLENALGRIDDELDEAAEVLEEVHLASERADRNTVRSSGEAYLSITDKLVK